LKGPSPGSKLYQEKGCFACHSIDGSPRVGPTVKGLLGKTETVLRSGKEQTVVVNEAYVRNYILHPNVDVIKGYPPIMPQVQMTDAQVNEIVKYLETLK
jgi:cytochrome c oxidase subunit 2